MAKELIVIALGGNAFIQKDQKPTIENQWTNTYAAASQIVEMVARGYRVVVTHGNGPQVGNVLEWMEALKERIPPLTMDVATAMTQGWLGYMLQQAIGNELERRGYPRKVVAIINQVEVSPDDPAFREPTKYIGPYYTDERVVQRLIHEKGWAMKRDPRGGWRRVVPSPDPISNVEIDVVRKLVEEGFIVIASGGGGVPVVRENGGLRGIEAVIDKDLAGEKLATSIGADRLIILTDVEGVYLDYDKPSRRLLRRLTLSEAEDLYFNKKAFPPGSMGPKVLACIRFLRNGGRIAAIGHLYRAIDVLEGKSGTTITI
ncbi:MAG: carbamate kinase [Desulfurococcales archaeon]|nr:carbamate kinase [Desulfurococcales archaeon]